MSRLLGVAFTATDIRCFDGLARDLVLEFDLLLLGFCFDGPSSASTIFVANGLNSMASDSIDQAISLIAKDYSHIGAVSSMASKDLFPRIAAKLDGAMVTDVISVISPSEFKRPIQAGTLIASVRAEAFPIVLTFRPANFSSEAPVATPSFTTVELVGDGKTRIVAEEGATGGNRPDLTQAKVIVSGGRPLKDADTFERVIGGFADSFGGAVGATRAAVDAGIAPNEAQVGQTGKIVAPNVYFAAGISGSTQHMAGIKDSKLIVAINKDPEAPIFEMADLGIVGDLFEVLPKLELELKGKS